MDYKDYSLEKKADLELLANNIKQYIGTSGKYSINALANQIADVHHNGFIEGEAEGYEKGKVDGNSEGYGRGYDEGFSQGYMSGESTGIEQGRNAEWSEFWEDFQRGGKKTDYSNTFTYWTDRIFKPKYDIKPSAQANSMFYKSTIGGDLQAKLESYGVVLDFSNTTRLHMVFQDANFKRIGVVDASKANYDDWALGNTFYNCQSLKTIDKFIVSENTKRFQQTFHYCTALENIIFEGVITKQGLNLSHSTKLTHDSLMSVLNCLKDYSEDTSGTAHSLTLGSTNLAKLTDAEKAIATNKGWTLA